MRNILIGIVAVFILTAWITEAHAIKYISGYSRSNGTYVRGHYRDTSNDGNSYNNANTLGYNNGY
jgi:hypothetical protein